MSQPTRSSLHVFSGVLIFTAALAMSACSDWGRSPAAPTAARATVSDSLHATTSSHAMATALAGGLVFVTASATVQGNDQNAQVNQQLALARAATAKYHDVNDALNAGYVALGTNPAEDDAFELVNFNLVDCTLDVTKPEALRYVESGGRLRLIAVEYAIPMACSPNPPEWFLPGTGEWEQEAGVPIWMMGVFVWSGASGSTP